MQVLVDELKRSVQDVPLSHAPILLGVLGALVAEVQLRIMLGKDSVPVTADTEGFLRVPEVATQLNISTYRVYELCRQGALQSVKLGKSVRVKPADLAAYLATQGA